MPDTLLITFLGAGRYKPARYRIGGCTHAAELFYSAALAKHLKPDLVVSLQTEEASRTHGTALAEAFRDFHHEVVQIPDGKSESELWSIFSALTSKVPREALLHLDITHGFRSLPVIGLIALNYLRVTRHVTIGGVYYGAWEAGKSSADGSSEPEVPTFDLTPFLELLDWTSAAEEFLRTGSATGLGSLLQQAQNRCWTDPGRSGDLPKALSSVGKSIDAASNNLLLLRIKSLAEGAESLERQLDRAQKADELARYASPFLEVLGPVKEELLRFRNTDLGTLREVIRWLVSKDHPDAALTLANEWLVSWMIVTAGNPDHASEEKNRRRFSKALSLHVDRWTERNSITDPDQETIDTLEVLEQKTPTETMRRLASLASRITDTRNDLNHAGFRLSPSAPATIHKLAREVLSDLDQLPLSDG